MPCRKLNVLTDFEPAREPAAAPLHRPQPLLAREDPAGSDKHIEPSRRILVVEDDFLVANEIEVALSDAGFDVAGVAASADEAVGLAESQRPTLVVMDVRLAGEHDGIHAAVEIFRKLGTRCIFATAYCDQYLLERAKPAMPLGWLQKPYAMFSLVNAVRRVFNPPDTSAAFPVTLSKSLPSSWPGLLWPSTPYSQRCRNKDARDKRGRQVGEAFLFIRAFCG
jgi:two-component system, response regulator PdtaR